MYVKNGIYREIPVNVAAPIEAGTVVTAGGTQAASGGADAFGIVTQRIDVIAPTGMMRVCVGGTIDLEAPQNQGVSISKTLQLALTGINFIPEPQPEKDPPELPTVSSNDNGKILKVSSGKWNKGNETVELPTVTASDDGKVLLVVDGAWAAVEPDEPIYTPPAAEE